MEPFYCPTCGHWTRHVPCQAITHNETGGAQRCSCRHEKKDQQ